MVITENQFPATETNMEPTQKPSPRTPLKEDDVDLGHLFYQTGGAISNFFRAIGQFFVAIGTAILYFLFFLRRNIIWLALGAIIGAGYGFYLLNKHGRNYHSEMTVRAKVLLCERASTACNKSRIVKIQNAENRLCFIYVLLLMIWST